MFTEKILLYQTNKSVFGSPFESTAQQQQQKNTRAHLSKTYSNTFNSGAVIPQEDLHLKQRYLQ